MGLVEYPTIPWQPFDPTHSGLDHMAFTVGDLKGVRAWAARLSDAEVVHSGVIEHHQASAKCAVTVRSTRGM